MGFPFGIINVNINDICEILCYVFVNENVNCSFVDSETIHSAPWMMMMMTIIIYFAQNSHGNRE